MSAPMGSASANISPGASGEPPGHVRPRERGARCVDDRREIEQHEVERGRARADSAQERAGAAADVEQAVVPGEIVGGERLGRDHRLRSGHQARVCVDRRVILRAARIGPVAGERAAAAAAATQQRHGIGQIGVKRAVVAYHRDHARIADERGTLFAQHHAPAHARDQPERGRRLEQPLGRLPGQADRRREFVGGAGAVSKRVEQPQFDAGDECLRPDETRDDVEQRARLPPRDWAGEREGSRAALESGIGEQAVAPAEPAEAEGHDAHVSENMDIAHGERRYGWMEDG